jgi:hypothetical protein
MMSLFASQTTGSVSNPSKKGQFSPSVHCSFVMNADKESVVWP